MASAYSHLFPHGFDLTKDPSTADKKSDPLAKDPRPLTADASAMSSTAFDSLKRTSVKQEESDSEDTSISPASRTQSLCSPTSLQPGASFGGALLGAVGDRTPHSTDRTLTVPTPAHSKVLTSSISAPAGTGNSVPTGSGSEKHCALSPGALGGSLPPMHMLQERMTSGSLPPLQMPSLSASWPPMGGMTSPGLMSPGGDAWMRKPRTKFSPDQLQALELEYQMDPFLSTSADKRADLAKKLNITEKNVQIWFQNQRRRRRAAAYSKMHYVFSGDHGDSVAQSMMYPPTTAGFSSTSSDGGDPGDPGDGGEGPLNMHADDSLHDDMMEEDEDESEADAVHDGTDAHAGRSREELEAANRSREMEAANRNREQASHDQAANRSREGLEAANRNREEETNARGEETSHDQGKQDSSRSHDVKPEEARDSHVVRNDDVMKKESNGEENGLEDVQGQGRGQQGQGYFMKENVHAFKDVNGKQGKIVNQNAAGGEILENNIDGVTEANSRENGAPIDQS